MVQAMGHVPREAAIAANKVVQSRTGLKRDTWATKERQKSSEDRFILLRRSTRASTPGEGRGKEQVVDNPRKAHRHAQRLQRDLERGRTAAGECWEDAEKAAEFERRRHGIEAAM